MELIDFSDYPAGQINYGGSERKKSILVPNGDGTVSDYMLKFRKMTEFGPRNNHISEYLGSHIFAFLGIPAQKTYLGIYEGEPVVACKSFVGKDEQFVPFNEVGESTLDQDKDHYQYEYNDIMQMLADNSKLTDVEETILMFWEMFIVDALTGNFDRHGANWGFLKKNNAYRLAPMFDNGSCLFPTMTRDEDMREVIESAEETRKRVYTFPTSQIKLNGRKSSYYDVISSLQFPACNDALVSVADRMDPNGLFRLIDGIPGITDTHRAFYRHMISARYERIILEPLRQLGGGR